MTGISFAIIRGIYKKYAKSGFVHVPETPGLVLLTWLQDHLLWERSSPVSLSCVTLPVALLGGWVAAWLVVCFLHLHLSIFQILPNGYALLD